MTYKAKKCPLKTVEKGIEVHIPQVLYDKIMYLVDKSPVEISGLGKCRFHEGKFEILSIHVPTQVNTATSTDLDAASVASIEMETIKEEGHLNFWWHSHVNMGAFWSGTDTDTIEEYGRHGFCLATVFNKRHETKTAYYQGGTDFYPAIFNNDLKLVLTEIVAPVNEELDKIYADNCRRPVYVNNYNKKSNVVGTVGKSGTKKQKKNSGQTTTGNTTGKGLQASYTLAKPETTATITRIMYKFEHSKEDGQFMWHGYALLDDKTYICFGAFMRKDLAKEGYIEWKKLRDAAKGEPRVLIGNRVEGEIHNEYPQLRWLASSKSFVSYWKWQEETTEITFDTKLDLHDIREEVVSGYLLLHPDTVVTDLDVENWYMTEHNIKPEDFYYGTSH